MTNLARNMVKYQLLGPQRPRELILVYKNCLVMRIPNTKNTSPQKGITTPLAVSWRPWTLTLWVSPSKWMLCTRIDHSRRKTLNSGSDLTEWVLPHTHTHFATKKHEPSKLNCKTFSDELTPLGMNSLSSHKQKDTVYENWPFWTKNSQLRIRFDKMSFTALWKNRRAEV